MHRRHAHGSGQTRPYDLGQQGGLYGDLYPANAVASNTYAQAPYYPGWEALRQQQIQQSFWPLNHGYGQLTSQSHVDGYGPVGVYQQEEASPSLPVHQLPANVQAHSMDSEPQPAASHMRGSSAYPSPFSSATTRSPVISLESENSRMMHPPDLPRASNPESVGNQSATSARPHEHRLTLPRPGNHRAVVIGVDYFNQKGQLEGRSRRAEIVYHFLQTECGYEIGEIWRLTEDLQSSAAQPTRKNIMSALAWLTENVNEGDRRLLFYTGHGRTSGEEMQRMIEAATSQSTQQRRTRKARQNSIDEEAQSPVETIFPVDFREPKSGSIDPERLDEILQPAKDKGAKITLWMEPVAGLRSRKRRRKGKSTEDEE
ncbi:Metacaspase-1 [Cyphellophora attinorum]|uniref:Metacaspase-1 n=1 Tax=Cyphellophora attinorum TaxID=1664694 RepID=A0A0N1H5E6_9EURO|nr:Metacaspase-1 [Phialophora attinorum]KPI37595.1 Metacaspase-1 [Phialophora attinorum]